MHGAGAEAERGSGSDLERLELLAHRAQLERGTPLAHEPRLVLDLVVLEAERLARLHEQELADVVLGLGPDELPPPWLLDTPRVDPVALARRHENRSAPSGMRWPAPIRRPWSRTLAVPSDAPGPTTARLRTSHPAPSSASSPTIEPMTTERSPTVARAPTTAFSTIAPAPSREPSPTTAR